MILTIETVLWNLERYVRLGHRKEAWFRHGSVP